MREGPLMGSDAFAPAFVHKVLDCSPSALLRQIEGFHEGRISGSS
jgi:hypothetical protein